MKKVKYIDHSKDIDYNPDKEAKHLIEETKAIQGLKVEIWDVDFQHALDGHPEVTIERIRMALTDPVKIVQSKRNNRVCLFYNLEIENDPDFGKIYFCVIVGVIREGKGKMETAYETTYIKNGNILYEKKNGGVK